MSTTDGKLIAVDVADQKVLWTRQTNLKGNVMIVSSQDDARVAVGVGLRVSVVDAANGSIVSETTLENGLVDLEILPDDSRLLAVERHVFEGEGRTQTVTTNVHVVELSQGDSRQFEVPNCSDDIIVPHHGESAILAPTTCVNDPISYIDLEVGNEHYVRNLPGFGPVALAPDGNLAVGFLDMALVDESLFDDPSQIPSADTRFHLMVIDSETLTYEFFEYGQNLPRYAMTPDGHVLLVDTLYQDNGRLFDIETGEFQDIEGAGCGVSETQFQQRLTECLRVVRSHAACQE